jgi:hypothetical protein
MSFAMSLTSRNAISRERQERSLSSSTGVLVPGGQFLVGVDIPDIAVPTHHALGGHLFEVDHLLIRRFPCQVILDELALVLWGFP